MISVFKYHSYGNDFLIVPPGQVGPRAYSDFSRSVCRRRTGAGADGCVFLETVPADPVPIRIFNCDGSEAGMSGNGARCACAYLHAHERVEDRRVRLQTVSGLKEFELLSRKEGVWEYRSSMGHPRFEPEAIPFRDASGLREVRRLPLQVADRTVEVSALWVGNPQCTVFVQELPGEQEFREVGAGLETHPRFPDRTNVSFVKVTRAGLEIRIWERGVGPTPSSGTGSCGAAVAALREGLISSPVTVSSGTGTQTVGWEPGAEMVLTGGACFIAGIDYWWGERGRSDQQG